MVLSISAILLCSYLFRCTIPWWFLWPALIFPSIFLKLLSSPPSLPPSLSQLFFVWFAHSPLASIASLLISNSFKQKKLFSLRENSSLCTLTAFPASLVFAADIRVIRVSPPPPPGLPIIWLLPSPPPFSEDFLNLSFCSSLNFWPYNCCFSWVVACSDAFEIRLNNVEMISFFSKNLFNIDKKFPPSKI